MFMSDLFLNGINRKSAFLPFFRPFFFGFFRGEILEGDHGGERFREHGGELIFGPRRLPEIAEAFTTAYPMFLTREGFAKWLREHYEVADGDPSDLMACLLRRRPV